MKLRRFEAGVKNVRLVSHSTKKPPVQRTGVRWAGEMNLPPPANTAPTTLNQHSGDWERLVRRQSRDVCLCRRKTDRFLELGMSVAISDHSCEAKIKNSDISEDKGPGSWSPDPSSSRLSGDWSLMRSSSFRTGVSPRITPRPGPVPGT